VKHSKLATFIGAAALVTLPSISLAQAAPNVLLIIADDMGIDASNCYSLGNQQADMPNIEALCAQGVVFDNAYSAPLCSPTRATIMTGQYGFRTGVGSAITRDNSAGLSADETSLFDVLAKTDYASNLIGKWHLASTDDDYDHPAQLGVSDFWGLFSGAMRDYSNWSAVSNGQRINVSDYSTTAITDKAIDWIDKQNDPWFLWLAYTAPHTPFHLPPEDLHSAELSGTKQDIQKDPLPYYNAMLEAMDTEIGRLLSTMDEATRNNTVVMFVGDNGTPGRVARSVYGEHGAKGSIYEGGVHVPLIVSGPGIEASRESGFVQTVDIFATVASIARAEYSTPDSYSFAPALYGQGVSREYVYVEHFGTESKENSANVYGWAMREGNYKLVQKDAAEAELFNLAEDPLEKTDLLADGISEDEAGLIANMQTRYQRLMTSQ